MNEINFSETNKEGKDKSSQYIKQEEVIHDYNLNSEPEKEKISSEQTSSLPLSLDINQVNVKINDQNNENSSGAIHNFQIPGAEQNKNQNSNTFDGFSPFMYSNVHNISFNSYIKGKNLFNSNK
jgi:hypothetical protein